MSESLALPQSRLESVLYRMAVLRRGGRKQKLAENLARQIDLGDAFQIAEQLGGRPNSRRIKAVVEEARTRELSPRQILLQAHRECAELIARNFVFDPERPFSLSLPDAEVLMHRSDGPAHYGKFYSSQQSEMEYKLARLRQQLRQRITTLSPKHAELVEMDDLLANLGQTQSRRLLARLPALVEQRFVDLRRAYQKSQPTDAAQAAADDAETWVQADGWLGQFVEELKQLLDAELELRLQLLIGLVEASESKGMKE